MSLLMPELPYAGTSGYSGSDTSEERARVADRSGKTALRQAQALTLISNSGSQGLTWKEFSDVTGLHHGSASGVLSVLHKSGRIARLKQTRDKCKIYVDVRAVQGRAVEAHGKVKSVSCPNCGHNL
jgi:DNA-binding MarR family transcriptional regulator